MVATVMCGRAAGSERLVRPRGRQIRQGGRGAFMHMARRRMVAGAGMAAAMHQGRGGQRLQRQGQHQHPGQQQLEPAGHAADSRKPPLPPA